MNRAILIGNLTSDPTTRTTTSGVAVTSFTLAVNRRFTNQQGVREADFINIVTWKQTAELCARYLSKGRKVAVVGTIQTRSYDAPDGTKRYKAEVVADEVEFIGSAQGGSGQGAAQPDPAPKSYDPRATQERMDTAGAGLMGGMDSGDDLPF